MPRNAGKFVNSVDVLYIGTASFIISPDGETIFFETKAGILQVIHYTPYIVIIILDYVMGQLTEESGISFIIGEGNSSMADSKGSHHRFSICR